MCLGNGQNKLNDYQQALLVTYMESCVPFALYIISPVKNVIKNLKFDEGITAFIQKLVKDSNLQQLLSLFNQHITISHTNGICATLSSDLVQNAYKKADNSDNVYLYIYHSFDTHYTKDQ